MPTKNAFRTRKTWPGGLGLELHYLLWSPCDSSYQQFMEPPHLTCKRCKSYERGCRVLSEVHESYSRHPALPKIRGFGEALIDEHEFLYGRNSWQTLQNEIFEFVLGARYGPTKPKPRWLREGTGPEPEPTEKLVPILYFNPQQQQQLYHGRCQYPVLIRVREEKTWPHPEPEPEPEPGPGLTLPHPSDWTDFIFPDSTLFNTTRLVVLYSTKPTSNFQQNAIIVLCSTFPYKT